MSLKLVLISPSGTIEKDGVLNQKDMAALGSVIGRLAKVGVTVAIWSNRKWSVTSAGTKTSMEDYLTEKAGTTVHYVGRPIGMPARQISGSVLPILEKFKVRLEDTILVGARDEDMQAGVNNKLLLLRPAWYGGNLAYGFELNSIEELARFCLLFGTRTHPFYWQVADADRRFYANALGPFSTYIEAFAKFGEDALNAAKYETGTLEFWHQIITSTLYFSGLIHKVDYVTVYPSHAAGKKEKAFYEVLDLLGKCFNKAFLHDLLLRHEDAAKSSYQKAADRKFVSQVNTVRLNQHPAKYGGDPRKTSISLNGKCVLVVDDICTSGRSLDTARAYFASAGASTILFSWLKTINTDFVSMDPTPKMSPFSKNMINAEPATKRYSYTANIVDAEAAKELDELLQKFRDWKV